MPHRSANAFSSSGCFQLFLCLLSGLILTGRRQENAIIKHVGILQFSNRLDTIVEDMKSTLSELGFQEGSTCIVLI